MISTLDTARYSQLLTKFLPKIIETEEEYEQSRRLLLELMRRSERSPEETALLKSIATLVKEFDERQEQPEPASPLEILLHLMEENGLRQVDLAGKIASKGVISEIINGKRAISKSQAKALGEMFHVSPALFI